jgi:hypothetical protein
MRIKIGNDRTTALRATAKSRRALCQPLAQKLEEMAKVKKKLTAAQKRARKKAKAERQKKYMWVFRNGKQVRIKRLPTIDGMDIDKFIQENADPIWLHQNEMWEYIQTDKNEDLF